jgi:hypothetical protein
MGQASAQGSEALAHGLDFLFFELERPPAVLFQESAHPARRDGVPQGGAHATASLDELLNQIDAVMPPVKAVLPLSDPHRRHQLEVRGPLREHRTLTLVPASRRSVQIEALPYRGVDEV